LHGSPSLHVDGAATPQNIYAIKIAKFNRKIVGNRHGVDVPGDDYAVGATQVGAGDNGIGISDDLEMGCRAKRLLNCVGKSLFVARNRFDIAELRGQIDHVGA
jgi:hypothetical protein